MKFKYQQIINIFTNLNKLKHNGIHFSGVEYKGEYKQWWSNGQLWFHCFYIEKGKREGEFKGWWEDGQLYKHCFYNGKGGYKGEYKEWWDNGKLKEYKIYNKDGSLKEKIV